MYLENLKRISVEEIKTKRELTTLDRITIEAVLTKLLSEAFDNNISMEEYLTLLDTDWDDRVQVVDDDGEQGYFNLNNSLGITNIWVSTNNSLIFEMCSADEGDPYNGISYYEFK